jgi:two-component system, NtrC family, response regulator AtoC
MRFAMVSSGMLLPRSGNVLIVTTDSGTTALYTEAAARLGLHAVHAANRAESLQRFEQIAPVVVILDLALIEAPQLQLPRRLTDGRQIAVIGVAPVGKLRMVVEAMLSGAADVLNKHATAHEVEQAIQAAVTGVTGVSITREEDLFRLSPKMQALEPVVARLAAVSSPVLIRGESGVGKEVIARVLHRRSDRSERSFLKLALTALPAEDVLSELEGAVAAASDGTLFVDEIGEASAALQARLLSILAGKGPKPRVIAATSADMNRLVTRGVFRKELYKRLALVTIDIPPLRERREEINALTHRFLERFACEFQRPMPLVTRSMADLLRGYAWPGNVRELESIVRRWVVLGDESSVRAQIEARQRAVRRRHAAPAGTALGLLEIGRGAAREAERVALQEALLRTRGNRAAAARELKISYRTLLQKLAGAKLAPPSRVKRLG